MRIALIVVPFVFAGGCSLLVDDVSDDVIDGTDEELYYLQKCQARKKPLFIPIQSHSLAPALFHCIRTTRFLCYLLR